MASSRDERGVVQFDALVPDLYDLSANTPDGRVGVLTDVELVSNKPVDGLRIGVEPGARVRVRHAGRTGYLQVEVFAGNALIATDALEPGMDRAFAAPVGDVLLRASTYLGPKPFDLPLTLAAGETRDVVFDGAWK